MKFPFWLSLFVIILLPLCAIVLWVNLEWRTAIDIIVLFAASLPAIIKNTPKLYLIYVRIKFWLVNPTLVLEIALELFGVSDSITIAAIASEFLAENKKENRLITESSTIVMLEYNQVVIEIEQSTDSISFPNDASSIETQSGSQVIRISAPNLHLGYRSTTKIIENQLFQLFEKSVLILKPSKTKYTLTVDFSKGNPFWSLFIRHLNQNCIKEFSLMYQDTRHELSSIIQIGMTKLTVVSQSAQIFKQSLIKALTFKTM